MRASVLVVFTALIGCGGSGLDSGSVPTVNDYEQKAIQLGCKFYVRCGFASKSQESACNGWLGGYEDAGVALVAKGISAGQLSYNASAAASCLNALATATCDINTLLLAEQSASCNSIVQAKVAVGGACQLDNECINGFCNTGTSGTACSGTCAAFAARGAACDGGSTRCSLTTDYCDSTKQVCTALLGSGQTCDNFSTQCASGLYCTTLGTTSTCLPPGGEGAPCDSSTGCANEGLYCNLSGSSPICQKRQPAGGACNGDGSGCVEGLACVINDPNGTGTVPGTCQVFADVGQACSGSTGHTSCAADATCDPTSHTCKLVGQAGDDCSTVSCGQQFYCNAAMKCAARIPYGQACTPATTGDDPCLASSCDATTLICGGTCQ